MNNIFRFAVAFLCVSGGLLACTSSSQKESQKQQPPHQQSTKQRAVLEAEQNASYSHHEGAETTSPEFIGESVARQLLGREYMQYRSDEFTGLHYAEAAVGYGALKFAATVRDENLLSELQRRYANPPYTEGLQEAGHVDASVYGILPLQRYLVNKDGLALYQGLELADAQWINTRSDGLTEQTRFWIDDIWMINSLQLQAFRATQNSVYLDRAALQTETYLRRLQQNNGFFYHGENAHFFWGRGNGWVAAGLAELLSELPKSHKRYAFIENRYRIMMKALLAIQAPSGLWRQLLDYSEAWEETSATAMFGYALAVGTRKGILSHPDYTAAMHLAWQGLQKHIDSQGQLGEICVGTGQSEDAQYYLQRPRMRGDLHGQAPLIWFATELVSNGSL